MLEAFAAYRFDGLPLPPSDADVMMPAHTSPEYISDAGFLPELRALTPLPADFLADLPPAWPDASSPAWDVNFADDEASPLSRGHSSGSDQSQAESSLLHQPFYPVWKEEMPTPLPASNYATFANFSLPPPALSSTRNTQDTPNPMVMSSFEPHHHFAGDGCANNGQLTKRRRVKRIFSGVRKLRKPYTCSDCGMVLYGHSSLVRHSRIHTGEKPFVCNVCNKAFRQKGTLTSHRVVHTKETPFECVICNLKFAHRATMNRHKDKMHRGWF